MGKLVRPAPRRIVSAERIIESSQRASMETRIETSPNVADPVEARHGSYNFILAILIRELRARRMTRDSAVDVMFKARDLFALSYEMVYGKAISLPQINARGR